MRLKLGLAQVFSPFPASEYFGYYLSLCASFFNENLSITLISGDNKNFRDEMKRESQLCYKEDWEKAQQRFKAWWKQEIIDRVVIQVYAPRLKVNKWSWLDSWTPFNIVKKWADLNFDMGYIISQMENSISSTYYGGDAIPFFFVNLGPGSIASYLGCPANFKDDTVWFGPPILNDWESSSEVKFDHQNNIWKITKELTSIAGEKGKHKFLVSFADIGGVMDIIASLVENEKLCLDLIEYPDKVKELRDYIVQVWIECYDELFDIIKKNQDGTVCWLPIWSPGRTYALQCDFSAMISPKMYEEFVAPEIQTLARHLDNVVYHLDGPDAVKHLDIILDIPEIDAIQWVPGEGTPPAIHWIPMLRKIQKKKKSLFLYAEGSQEVEHLISGLSPEGLLISTSCNSEDEAKIIVKKTKEWTAKRIKNIRVTP